MPSFTSRLIKRLPEIDRGCRYFSPFAASLSPMLQCFAAISRRASPRRHALPANDYNNTLHRQFRSPDFATREIPLRAHWFQHFEPGAITEQPTLAAAAVMPDSALPHYSLTIDIISFFELPRRFPLRKGRFRCSSARSSADSSFRPRRHFAFERLSNVIYRGALAVFIVVTGQVTLAPPSPDTAYRRAWY